MPFEVVSGIGRETGVLDGSGDRRREGAALVVNVGHPIVTNGILCVRGNERRSSSQITLGFHVFIFN